MGIRKRKMGWFIGLACSLTLSACGAGGGMLPPNGTPAAPHGFVHRTITGAEAGDIRDGGGILLDVRSPEEYAVKHIAGSLLIPLAELESRLDELDRDAAIIVYCRSGRRSLAACELLFENGYGDIYDMQGIDNWPDGE